MPTKTKRVVFYPPIEAGKTLALNEEGKKIFGARYGSEFVAVQDTGGYDALGWPIWLIQTTTYYGTTDFSTRYFVWPQDSVTAEEREVEQN